MNETDTPTETQLRLVTADSEELVPEEPEDIGNIGVTGGTGGAITEGVMPGQMTLGYGQILIRPIRPNETTEAGVIVADAKTRQFLCSHVVDVGIGMAQDLIGKRILHSARVGRAYQLNGVEYFIIWGVHTPPGAATLSDATIGGDIIAILEEDVQVEY